MERILKPGDTVTLDQNGARTSYTIQECRGRGSTCVAYLALCHNPEGTGVQYILKEYNPHGLSVTRDADGALQSREPKHFQEGLARFLTGVERQKEIRLKPGSVNSTPTVHAIAKANNTVYAVVNYAEGRTYNPEEDSSLANTVKTLLSVTKAVKNCHENGLLHLDLKPDNILILPDGREQVALIDFGSVIDMDSAKTAQLSYTQGWAAPEQIVTGGREDICEATDFFAIGEMLFCHVMKRHSKNWERRPFTRYPLDDAPGLKGPDSQLKRALTDFFRHTLCADVKGRWQKVDDVIKALEGLKKLAQREFALRSSSDWAPKEYFIGREKKLEQIGQALRGHKALFVCGMGGMGKSELVKIYAQRAVANKEYDEVLFVRYPKGFRKFFDDDGPVWIENFKRDREEPSAEFAKRKMQALKEALQNQRVLLIVDNLDEAELKEDEEKLWKELQELECHMLVTSRLNVWERRGRHILSLGPFEDPETAMELFENWCGRPLDGEQREAAWEIVGMVGGNLLAIEIFGLRAAAGRNTPTELYRLLIEKGLEELDSERICMTDDGRERRAFQALKILMRSDELSRRQIPILQAAALFLNEKISKSSLRAVLAREDDGELDRLYEDGWLSAQGETVSIHPLIADIALSEGVDPNIVDAFYQELKNSILSSEMRGEESVYEELDVAYFFATLDGGRACDRLRRCAGEDHPGTLCAKGHVGRLYLAHAELCLDNHEPSLAEGCLFSGAACSGQSAQWFALEGDVCYARRSSSGRYIDESDQHREAIGYYEKALEHPDELDSHERVVELWGNLGTLHMELGEYDEAERCFQEALQLSVQYFGEESVETAMCWADHGELHCRHGDSYKAMVSFQKTLNIYARMGDEASLNIVLIQSKLEELGKKLGL